LLSVKYSGQIFALQNPVVFIFVKAAVFALALVNSHCGLLILCFITNATFVIFGVKAAIESKQLQWNKFKTLTLMRVSDNRIHKTMYLVISIYIHCTSDMQTDKQTNAENRP